MKERRGGGGGGGGTLAVHRGCAMCKCHPLPRLTRRCTTWKPSASNADAGCKGCTAAAALSTSMTCKSTAAFAQVPGSRARSIGLAPRGLHAARTRYPPPRL